MSGAKIELRGVSWGHTRGMLPLHATAMALQDQGQPLQVQWEVRSLQHFADQSVAQLAQRYDLLVIDHPSIGEAVHAGAFLPLDKWVPAQALQDLARHSVGVSHWSYQYPDEQGQVRQWALALDAATPVAAWPQGQTQRPADISDLLEWGRAGRLSMAAWPLDMLMHFYGICEALGEAPFLRPSALVAAEVGEQALVLLRSISDACGPQAQQSNPIAALRRLALQPGKALAPQFCPMAYGYSNYARRPLPGQRRLSFGSVPTLGGRPWRTTLGGAGIAVSAHCANPEAAAQHALWLAGAQVQTGLYTEAGGQPGHRQAWLDEFNNDMTGGYFRDTLAQLDSAYLRPRYPGYIEFQSEGTEVMARYLRHELDTKAALAQLQEADVRHRKGWLNHDDARLHALAQALRAAPGVESEGGTHD
ncbi:carbohydrate ABC transporter substrate-binding protein [Roseateles sp. BYS180W]|uniref:Carbohydrate ABC transporter substrate-binding protein n=1 Tax=Roseateles rivi TaxID=3299028 RepID=A0ABW7FWC4_9BURK